MKFGEKVRSCRKAAGLTQEELAKRLEMSKRTIEGYEAGKYYPRTRDVYKKLGEVFGVEADFFLLEDEAPSKDARAQAKQLIENAKALYAGGTLNDEDKDALAKALMDAYIIAKARSLNKSGEE